MTTTYHYDAFGNVSTVGSDVQPFQYTGRENDETGLYYYRARYFSPEMRRFISQDPIGLKGGINFYAYVLGDPISLIDIFGLSAIDCTECHIKEGCECDKAKLETRISQVKKMIKFYSGEKVEWSEEDKKVSGSLGETHCDEFGIRTEVAEGLDKCIEKCVWAHENKHREQCIRLGFYDFNHTTTEAEKEIPAYQREWGCLNNLLNATTR